MATRCSTGLSYFRMVGSAGVEPAKPFRVFFYREVGPASYPTSNPYWPIGLVADTPLSLPSRVAGPEPATSSLPEYRRCRGAARTFTELGLYTPELLRENRVGAKAVQAFGCRAVDSIFTFEG